MEYARTVQEKGSDNSLIEIKDDIQMHFLEMAKTKLVELNVKLIGGMSLNNDSQIIAWFNNQPFHTSALSLNLLHNALIKWKLGSNHSIHVINHPLPFRIEASTGLSMISNSIGFELASFLPFIMAFVSSFYVIFYVKERVSKAKLLQHLSGLNVFTFWITSFLFDFVTFILSSFIMLLVLWAFQAEGWKTIDDLTPIIVSLICFGYSMLPIVYLSSIIISVPSTGFVRISIFFIFTGTADEFLEIREVLSDH